MSKLNVEKVELTTVFHLCVAYTLAFFVTPVSRKSK